MYVYNNNNSLVATIANTNGVQDVNNGFVIKIDTNGNYLYKVPRSSTYKLNGSIPFYFGGDDSDFRTGAFNRISYELSGKARFKIIGLVERSTNPSIE